MKVRIGFSLGTQGLRDDAAFPRIVDALERLPFDSLWLSERLTSPAVDPLVGLAVAAGRTRRLKLGTGVLVLPGRDPVRLAKELASLDRLSQGRLLLAFGLGVADAAERRAFDADMRERAAWFDEALPLLRRLWTEDEVHHEGPRFSYRGVRARPTPLQSPLEVWIGSGLAPSALRRVGRLADGWLPSLCTPAEAAAGRVVIEQSAAEAGREIDPEHFGASLVYTAGGMPPSLAASVAGRRPGIDPSELIPNSHTGLRQTIERFVDVGVSKFVVRPAEEPADWTSELEKLAERVLPLQT